MNSLYTVKKNSDFRRLYTLGKSAVTSRMVVYCRKNRLGRNRTGVTASTKLGHAVVRNRIRRQFREIVRLNSDKLVTGYDLILVARGKAVGAEYRKLEKNFLEACAALKLLVQETAKTQSDEAESNRIRNSGNGISPEKRNLSSENAE